MVLQKCAHDRCYDYCCYILQAFCLPIIQTVFETLRDIKEGKASKSAASLEGATGRSTEGNTLTL